MTDTNGAISNELQFKAVIDELEGLLRQQLELARKGNIAEVETLAGKTHILAEQMSESELVAGPLFEERRKGLQELYAQLCLALSAQIDDVSQSLGRVCKAKKTVTLYRDNV